MAEKTNLLKASLEGGAARRRTPGERSGAGALPEEEKLLTVSIPLSLHRDLKAGAATRAETMKQLVTRALRAELDR